MIVESLHNIIYFILNFILSIIPDLPDLPQNLHDTLINFVDLIFNYGGNFIGLFVRISTLKVVLPLLILAINFDKIYEVIMWIIKKLPIDIN